MEKTKNNVTQIKQERISMKSNKELDNQELDNVSGGSVLEKYLKHLAEKDKPLVDDGIGTELDLNPSTSYDEAGNLIIVKRDKDNHEL